MSWLADLLGKEIRTLVDGVESILPMRKTLRIVGSSAIEAKDNPTDGTTDLLIDPSGSLSDVLGKDNDAGGIEIKNLGEPKEPTSALRVQDESNTIVLSSSGTVTIDTDTFAGRPPANAPVIVRFTGNGAKKLIFGADLGDGTNGLLVTVLKSAGNSSVSVEDAGGGTINGQAGEVLVQPAVADFRTFTLSPVGSPRNWFFVGQPRVDGSALLSSAVADGAPALVKNIAIDYVEELGARRRTGSSAVGVYVFHRVSRSTFDTASQTLISGGISASEIPADCMIVAESDVIAVGSVRYAAKLMGTFQVSSGSITKLFDAAIGPALPAELSTLHFNITSNAIGVQLVQPSSGPSWTMTTRTKFTVAEDP